MSLRASRMKRLRAAVLNRVSYHGDMDVQVRTSTVVALLDWAGIRCELMEHIRDRQETFCDLPAFVLESLVDLSERRAA